MLQKQPLVVLIAEYLANHISDTHASITLDFLNKNDNFWQKENREGHITASVWILNETRTRALLTHHRKLDRWFQLGGHIESEDTDIFAACLREAREESGLKNLNLLEKSIFDIDVHLIPEAKNGFPAHFHHDIRVLLLADDSETIFFDENESKSVKWFDLQTLKLQFSETSLLRMIEKTSFV